MPFPAPIRAVLLDMDGTLLDTETIYVGSMFAALADMGLHLEQSLVHAMIGLPGQECMALLRDSFAERFQYKEFQPIYVAHRSQRMQGGIPLKPGTVELLDLIDAAGIKVAVATSSNRDNAHTNLANAGLLPPTTTPTFHTTPRRSAPIPRRASPSRTAMSASAPPTPPAP